ncbi:MAG: hypothetical protein KHX03_02570 [Clostridium sp.]|nr:hypothetical protein [Clostridium sp.]
MNINFSQLKPYTAVNNHIKPLILSFKSSQISKSDTFEKQSDRQVFQMSVYNPFTLSYSSDTVDMDLSRPQKIQLSKNSRKRYSDKTLSLDYDPDRTGYLFDKQRNRRLKVVILKAKSNDYENAYLFMSPNLKREYGYVSFTDCVNPKERMNIDFLDEDLLIDYPQLGIQGRRIIVDYLQNWNDSKIGGIGRLADKLTVEYCLENNMKPIIVSNADHGSHAAHYLRGKRFLPLSKDSYSYDSFKSKYGSSNVNEVLKKLFEQAKKNDEFSIDVSNWGLLPMYMPEELAQKYIKELKSEKK